MGLFDFLKNKEKPASVITYPAVLGAVSSGTVVPMSEIPDEVFSQGILGKCCGIEPEEGKVFAPIDGKVSQVSDTLHAVGIEAGGMDILIHVGIDTVEMAGDGFSVAVKQGQTIRKGDLLLTMDLNKIRAAGHPTTIVVAVTNSDAFAAVEPTGAGTVHSGDNLLRISK